MEDLLLPNARLADALHRWQAAGWAIHAPRAKQNIVVVGHVDGLEDVNLDVLLPDLPPKHLVFPQSEDTARFRLSPPRDVEPLSDAERVLAFGLRDCDARGIHSIDPVFLDEPADPHYAARRERLALVGIACNRPAPGCRCTSCGGGPHATEGLDLQLVDLGCEYLARPVTARGRELLSALDGLTSKTAVAHAKKADGLARAAEAGMTKVETTDAAALYARFEDLLWKRHAAPCIRCGTCTFVCPTCHCFDIEDIEYVRRGRRFRCWDACMFWEYSLHASGHNPRPTRSHRWRNRVSCKFWYFPQNWKVPGCVGCGRCVLACPVNIDIFECAREVSRGG